MKFSFFMMPVHHPSENPTLAFHRDIDLIPFVEDLDYDGFYIGEHHSGGWETMPAPEMALSMAAARTGRIRLGTSVVNLPFHHPFHVAERIAFLDHLTRGRAVLGIGPSNLVTDKKLFRLGNDRLYPMLSEAADIIVRLLEAGDPISHHGEFWRFEGMRLQLRSYQQPRLPLALPTSGSAQNLDLAARHGMELWTPCGRNRPGGGNFAALWDEFETACARHGRKADRIGWSLVTSFYLAETREEAWADVETGILRETEYFASIGLKRLYEAYPGQPVREFTARSCADRRDWCIGTPDDAVKWIEDKLQENGPFGGVMLTTHDWARSDKLKRSLELFARYVMPKFRGSNATYHDEWERIGRAVSEDGEVSIAVDGKPSNLAAG